MMGIQGRSLRATVRCSVDTSRNQIASDRAMRSFGARNADLGFFDASTAVFPTSRQEVLSAIMQNASAQRMSVVARLNRGNLTLLHFGYANRFDERDQDIIAISDVSGGTRLSLIDPRYRQHTHSYSVSSNVPDKSFGYVPSDRDYAYLEVTRFYGSIANILGLTIQ
jgi:hypothetical protein